MFNSTLGCLSVVWENSVTMFPRYLNQSKCSTTNMNTRSLSANPPSQPLLSLETFEELMEISQVPHEKEDLRSRVSRFEAQLLQLLNDNLALQGQCDALTASVKFLEDSMTGVVLGTKRTSSLKSNFKARAKYGKTNLSAPSIPKIVSASNKCKKMLCPKYSQFC